jgi:transposase-like protein
MRGGEVEAKWRGLISEHGQSGKSVAAFCRERGVRASQMFYWKHRVPKRAMAEFVQLGVAPAPGIEQGATRARAIEVRLTGGRSVVVEPGFDASHLRALLEVLESQP